MALGPDKAPPEDELTPEELSQVEEFEKQIDQLLKTTPPEGFYGRYEFRIPGTLQNSARNALGRRYHEAGWGAVKIAHEDGIEVVILVEPKSRWIANLFGGHR